MGSSFPSPVNLGNFCFCDIITILVTTGVGVPELGILELQVFEPDRLLWFPCHYVPLTLVAVLVSLTPLSLASSSLSLWASFMSVYGVRVKFPNLLLVSLIKSSPSYSQRCSSPLNSSLCSSLPNSPQCSLPNSPQCSLPNSSPRVTLVWFPSTTSGSPSASLFNHYLCLTCCRNDNTLWRASLLFMCSFLLLSLFNKFSMNSSCPCKWNTWYE